jgi:hypothetical protein
VHRLKPREALRARAHAQPRVRVCVGVVARAGAVEQLCIRERDIVTELEIGRTSAATRCIVVIVAMTGRGDRERLREAPDAPAEDGLPEVVLRDEERHPPELVHAEPARRISRRLDEVEALPARNDACGGGVSAATRVRAVGARGTHASTRRARVLRCVFSFLSAQNCGARRVSKAPLLSHRERTYKP